MATTSITFRMDEDLRKQAEILFAKIGMNMTTAFTIFTKTAVRQQRIPSDLAIDPFYPDTNMKRLRKAIADGEAGKSKLTAHELTTADDD